MIFFRGAVAGVFLLLAGCKNQEAVLQDIGGTLFLVFGLVYASQAFLMPWMIRQPWYKPAIMRLKQPVNTASFILFVVGFLMILYGVYHIFWGSPNPKTLSWGDKLRGAVPYVGKSISLKQLWAFVGLIVILLGHNLSQYFTDLEPANQSHRVKLMSLCLTFAIALIFLIWFGSEIPRVFQ